MCRAHLCVLRELVSSDKVNGKVQLHFVLLRLLDQLAHDLCSLRVVQRLANLCTNTELADSVLNYIVRQNMLCRRMTSLFLRS